MHRAGGWAKIRRSNGRRGIVLAIAVMAMLVLLGVCGLCIDIGQAVYGLQQCQNVADAGALAGSQELPYPTPATTMARSIATANVPTSQTSLFSVNATYYAKDATVPNYGTAPYGGAVLVTAAKNVRYVFLRALGFRGVTVHRSSVATKIITGTCISPMWISNATVVQYGVQLNMLMADGPHCAGIPGSFGFLTPNGGVDFDLCLKGLITPEQAELQRLRENDYVYAYTGLGVGHFRGDLATDVDSRLKRAKSIAPWSGDTFASFHGDNPRIMIVPFVDYIDGTGSGARFAVRRFGAFWLEDVITNGNERYIQGRFIDFTTPGGTGYGIKTTHLVQ